MAAITVLLLLVSILGFSSAMPLGAPAGACVNLQPAATPHGAESTEPNPYTLTIEGLLNVRGYYFYQPGYTYNGKILRALEMSVDDSDYFVNKTCSYSASK